MRQEVTWRFAADRGSKAAQDKLRGPEFPNEAEYLWIWAMELFGRSGISEYGIDALTYTTLAHWAVLTQQYPTPREVLALLRIDAALRNATPTRDEPDEPEPKPQIPWPTRKPNG